MRPPQRNTVNTCFNYNSCFVAWLLLFLTVCPTTVRARKFDDHSLREHHHEKHYRSCDADQRHAGFVRPRPRATRPSPTSARAVDVTPGGAMRYPTQAARRHESGKQELQSVQPTKQPTSLPELGPTKDVRPSPSPSPLRSEITPRAEQPLPDVAHESIAPVKTKVCVKCHQEKTLLEFHKNSRSADGLHSYCKDCNRAQALAHIRAEKARKALLRAAKKAAANSAE